MVSSLGILKSFLLDFKVADFNWINENDVNSPNNTWILIRISEDVRRWRLASTCFAKFGFRHCTKYAVKICSYLYARELLFPREIPTHIACYIPCACVREGCFPLLEASSPTGRQSPPFLQKDAACLCNLLGGPVCFWWCVTNTIVVAVGLFYFSKCVQILKILYSETFPLHSVIVWLSSVFCLLFKMWGYAQSHSWSYGTGELVCDSCVETRIQKILYFDCFITRWFHFYVGKVIGTQWAIFTGEIYVVAWLRLYMELQVFFL